MHALDILRRIRKDLMKIVVQFEENPDDIDYLMFELEDVIAVIDNTSTELRRKGSRRVPRRLGREPRPKRKRSKKQQLLDSMAKKAWDKYKRKTPNGKKTYIDIRTRVSKSQDYKKKAKKL